MRVQFWGTRGSIATPGPQTVRHGGNTSCVEVRTQRGTLLVLDAGTGLRSLGDALMAEGSAARRGHILIGHTHWDHIQGFPFFAPLFVRGNEWDVYAPRGFGPSLRETLAGQMQYTYFPVSLDALGATIRYHDLVEGSFTIDDVRVTACYLNHPALTLGYRLDADGVALVYATDHECHSRAAALPGPPLGRVLQPAHPGDRRHSHFIAGADLLIHDTQYTAAEYPSRVGWGHSTLEYVVDMAVASGVKQLALFHHDPRRDDAGVDALVAAGRQRVLDAGGSVELFAAAEGGVVELSTNAVAATLPAADALAAVDTGALAVKPVLIVCRDADLAQRLRGVVEAEEIPVVTADTGAGALDIARIEGLALAMIERRLGAEDGLALCRTLHANCDTADLPVVMLAAAEDTADVAEEAGVSDWLVAPFSPEYARTKLRAWLLRTRARWERAPLPADEEQRLRALRRLSLLDTPAEERFDRITRLAARLFEVPIALLTLVDEDRQWFKSRFGDIEVQTPREQAFCAHAILGMEALVVIDALRDDRFADNPLVTAKPHVRFYAGQPIAAPDGSRIGTLCVMDHRPRDLAEAELQVLRDLGALVERELGVAESSGHQHPSGGRRPTSDGAVPIEG